ncbi:hypothetical protein ACFZBU_35415 [Embleya sp. NPDC008237]|uniref:hypothetical protein n=1 Tax=Embleya sp. NPDC008237 TaxID=3363978 RepID=UPI0036E2E100
MFLLGLLLAACAGAFAALLIAYNTSGGPEYTVTIFGTDMVTLNSLAIFCSGLALGLIFSLGLLLMGGKARLSRARRNRERRARDRAALERDSAAAREDAAKAHERAAEAEARAGRAGQEPVGADEADTTWSADTAAQPETHTESGGAHRRPWHKK